MKKVKTLLLAVLATTLLAGCETSRGSSGSTEATSQGPSKPVIPSKSGWTEEEELLMSESLGHDLPFYLDLAFVEPGEEDSEIFAKGNYGSALEIAAYGQLLENKGFVEYDFLPEDLADVAEYSEKADPVVYAYFENEAGYVPYKGLLVAVGLEDETERLMLTCSRFYYIFDSNFTGDNRGYNGEAWEASQGLKDLISWWISAIATPDVEGESQSEWEARRTATEANVTLPSGLNACSFVGIDDYQYLNPFTAGNYYSDEFFIQYDLYFAGFSTEEGAAYEAALAANEYEYDDETLSYPFWKLVEDEGTYIVVFEQDDEFWKVEQGEDASGALCRVGFIPAEEEAAA